MMGWRWWVGVVVLVLACLGVARAIRWAAGPLHPRPDPTQAVRDSAARVHAADSVRWAVTVQNLTRVYTTLQRERDSLRKLRNAKPVVVYVRDSRMANVPSLDTLAPPDNSSSGAGLSDSTPMVHLVDYQSLERELSIADSVIDTQREIIRADSLAYARLASLRAEENRIHKAEVTTLRGALAKARRGCRVLGLLPCPEVSAGYGATLTGGQVRTGPVLAVTLPVRW